MRYVIVGRKRQGPPWVYYITPKGCISTSGDHAAVVTTLADVRAELLYWRRTKTAFDWYAEKLPPRVPLSTAVLRGAQVDL